MHPLFAAAGLLCVAAATPGPNNLVVLHVASHAGLRGAMPAIVGILLGGLLLLAAAALGAQTAFATYPWLRPWIGLAGSLYLAWLGASLCAAAIASQRAATTSMALPAGLPGLIVLQFLNPKSWVMVLTVLATVPASGPSDHLLLAGLFVLIPGVCLLLWAALGAWLARWLAEPAVCRGVDMVMGALLLACAFLLLITP